MQRALLTGLRRGKIYALLSGTFHHKSPPSLRPPALLPGAASSWAGGGSSWLCGPSRARQMPIQRSQQAHTGTCLRPPALTGVDGTSGWPALPLVPASHWAGSAVGLAGPWVMSPCLVLPGHRGAQHVRFPRAQPSPPRLPSVAAAPLRTRRQRGTGRLEGDASSGGGSGADGTHGTHGTGLGAAMRAGTGSPSWPHTPSPPLCWELPLPSRARPPACRFRSRPERGQAAFGAGLSLAPPPLP